jgi:hypothetical protein
MRLGLLGVAAIVVGVGALRGSAAEDVPVLKVPMLEGDVQIDGDLSEPCYKKHSPLEDFKIASELAKNRPPRTRAWVFWRKDKLIVAYECEDSNVIAQPKSDDEMAVDHQDRVELFLWNGRPKDAYLCLELAPRGAVLDYSARFHRQLDTAWNAKGLKVASALTKDGYRVEAELPAETALPFGIKLAEGENFRGGLFRGNYQTGAKDERPMWITWVDAGLAKPDFHVAKSFGTFVLVGP